MNGLVTDLVLHILNPLDGGRIPRRVVPLASSDSNRRDDMAVLSMTVRGTEELRNWILGFGP